MQELPQAFPRVQTRQQARDGSLLESLWRAVGAGIGATRTGPAYSLSTI